MAKIDHAEAIEKTGLTGCLPMFLEGELCPAAGGEVHPSTDPATGQSLSDFPLGRSADVERAVAAARKAFGPWRALGAAKRAKHLEKLAELIKEHSKTLSMVESLDNGMPRAVARSFSTKALVKNLTYYASWADKLYGEVVPITSQGGFDYTLREPLGVVAALVAWNTPLLFLGSKLGPALVTGNVVILKPSERASLSTLKVAELIAQAGFPRGVVQILTGDAETGAALVRHPGIDKVTFTGGGGIARKILADLAPNLTPAALELGGKSPNIIFGDANLDKAGMMSTFGVFSLAGQACAAGSRLLVHRSIHDDVVDRIKMMASGLPIGDPLEGSTMLGPLISKQHRERVEGYLQSGIDEGATVAHEGALPDGLPEEGGWLAPRIFTGVTPEMRIWKEEIFGPVLCVTPFDTESEAIELANQTEYGLGAGIWTQDVARAIRVAGRVAAGNVWINQYGMVPHTAPFGGVKASGWGRDGGRDALLEYTQVKNVFLDVSG